MLAVLRSGVSESGRAPPVCSIAHARVCVCICLCRCVCVRVFGLPQIFGAAPDIRHRCADGNGRPGGGMAQLVRAKYARVTKPTAAAAAGRAARSMSTMEVNAVKRAEANFGGCSAAQLPAV